MTIYTVFVEHTCSIRSFAKIATTDYDKAKKAFDHMVEYFEAYRKTKAESWHNTMCITHVDCKVINFEGKAAHIIHFDKFEN